MNEITERVNGRIGECVQCTRLDNGLAIYVIGKKGFAKSYAFFAADYGGMDVDFRLDGADISGPAGVAHFLEHKMFDMPDYNALNRLSANGASANAFTSTSMTAYHFESTENFYDNLRTLLEFVTTPYFTAESVEKEQGIIGQEIGMGDDDPNRRCYREMLRCLYAEHPLRLSITGTVDSISEITPEVLNSCHKAFYSPRNMVLCCCGDLDITKIAETAQEITGGMTSPEILRRRGENEQELPSTRCFEMGMEVAMPQFDIGIKLRAPSDGMEYLGLPLLTDMACSMIIGKSSPLYSALYDEGLINSSLYSGGATDPGAAYAMIAGESREPEKVFERIFAEAARIAKEGVDPSFFERTVKSAYGSEIRGLNSMENLCYNQAEAHFRGFDQFAFPELYDALSPELVQSFIAEYFVPERAVMSVIKPL